MMKNRKTSLQNNIFLAFVLLIVSWGIVLTNTFQFFLSDMLRDTDLPGIMIRAIDRRFTLISTGLTLAGIVLATGGTLLLSRKITRPLYRLKRAMDLYRSGDPDIDVGEISGDEIGELAVSFNRMIENIQMKQAEVDRNREMLEQGARDLETKISERTQELERSQAATLNILEDLQYAKNMLEKSEANFRNMISGSADSMIIVDKDNTVRFANPQAETLFSKKGGALVGDIFGYSIKEDTAAEIDILNADGSFLVGELRSSNTVWEGNDSFLLVIRDVTERRKAEERLKEAYRKLETAQEQLIQFEKMEAIGRMASGVAHEVKNPLGIILQGVNFLENSLSGKDETNDEILGMIKKNVARADSIIRALVDFSRAEQLSRTSEDINDVLSESIRLVEHEAKLSEVDVILSLQENLPRLLVDKGKIEQVIVNLMNNAIHSMPDGGKIHIRSLMSTFDEPGISVGGRRDDRFKVGEDAVVLEIEDQGTGITENNLNKIFEPFFTTKGPKKGTGLGLAVCKNIIEMHDGIIKAESDVGRGTKFSIYFKVNDGGENG